MYQTSPKAPAFRRGVVYIEENRSLFIADGLEETWFDLLEKAGVSEREIILARNMRKIVADLDAVNFQEDIYMKIHGEYRNLTTPNLFCSCVLHEKVPGLEVDIPFLIISDYKTVREVLTQDQIRALMCHEISHYLLGHPKEITFTDVSKKRMAEIEMEADKKALEIMLKNSMNPQDLIDGIENITSALYRIATADVIALAESIDNHPQPAERVAAIQRLASAIGGW